MKKMWYIAGILVFGSLWGFSEVIIGTSLYDAGLPSSVIMTGFFAMIFLVMSRMIYRQPGMQLGMGLVAGALRVFNPYMGCHLCSALAIMTEGVLFEIIWYKLSFDSIELKKPLYQGSLGLITAYIIFVGGYIVTQILTPIVAGATFYFENLLIFMPQILARGLLPAVIGGILLPTALLLKKADLKLKDRLYYPLTISVSILCWCIVIGNWYLAI